MTSPPEAVRDAVSKKLRYRQNRWFILPITLACEVAGLYALGNGPALLVLLPVIALPTLILIIWLGRYRLPDDEWDDGAAFGRQIATVKSCVATHLFFRGRYSRNHDEERKVRVATRRSHHGIKGKNKFLAIYAPGVVMLMTPRSYWIQHNRAVHSGSVTGLGIDVFSELEKVHRPRRDDEVIGSTWLYSTKYGERDLRYRDNRELWEVRRYGVELTFGAYLWAIKLYAYDDACRFANAFSAIAKQGPAITYAEAHSDEDEEVDDVDIDPDDCENDLESRRAWHLVLGVSPNASLSEIKKAYYDRLREYHPDRVMHLGPKLRQLADEEAVLINQAYDEAMCQVR